jgi:hypothetical protein
MSKEDQLLSAVEKLEKKIDKLNEDLLHPDNGVYSRIKKVDDKTSKVIYFSIGILVVSVGSSHGSLILTAVKSLF